MCSVGVRELCGREIGVVAASQPAMPTIQLASTLPVSHQPASHQPSAISQQQPANQPASQPSAISQPASQPVSHQPSAISQPAIQPASQSAISHQPAAISQPASQPVSHQPANYITQLFEIWPPLRSLAPRSQSNLASPGGCKSVMCVIKYVFFFIHIIYSYINIRYVHEIHSTIS